MKIDRDSSMFTAPERTIDMAKTLRGLQVGEVLHDDEQQVKWKKATTQTHWKKEGFRFQVVEADGMIHIRRIA